MITDLSKYTIEEQMQIREDMMKNLLTFCKVSHSLSTHQQYRVAPYHEQICKALDDVINGKTQYLMINIAPRYGKTELVCKKFVEYGFAFNPKCRFLHLSYSDDLVQNTSKEINETMQLEWYRRFFPNVKLTSNGAKHWETAAGGEFYAVSAAGQVTGFGAGRVESDDDNTFAGAIIIDDPIKPEDALSDIQRERVNQRYDSTIKSRVNAKNTPIIIVMQRLHEKDLCGYLQNKEGEKWKVLSLPCLDYDDDKPVALCDWKHSVKELLDMKQNIPYVFETQYQQNPTPLEGLMYTAFRTYEVLPEDAKKIKNYTDTADTGADFLCSIDYAESSSAIYVLNVLFTDKPMEYTEPETARMLTRDGVEEAVIESNNGGRGFKREVERQCREMGNLTTRFIEFAQTSNKQTRIFTNSAKVNNVVYMPKGWEYMWKDFYNAITTFRKSGKNEHDDAPDALTGAVERFGTGKGQYNIGFGHYGL